MMCWFYKDVCVSDDDEDHHHHNRKIRVVQSLIPPILFANSCSVSEAFSKSEITFGNRSTVEG